MGEKQAKPTVIDNEQICPEFWKWLPKEHAETDLITKLNMEVAFRAGKELALQQNNLTI
jgi:hypothetical protein